MLSNAQMDLNDAVEDSLAAARKVAETSRDLQRELSELRDMHSQLARLNVERQETIRALADALLLARKGLIQSGELPDEAWTQIDNALELAGLDHM